MDIKTMSKEELMNLRDKYQQRLDFISDLDMGIGSLREAYALSKKIEEIDLLLK